MLPERTPVGKDATTKVECLGCGAETTRDLDACPICGKLASEGFQPLDTIRSSYNLQGRKLPSYSQPDTDMLFPRGGNSISDTAWACTVYSMVPYLGIMFVPVAMAIGGFGYLSARRDNDPSVGRTALKAVGISALLLIVQIVFWWLLYLIPEIGI